jgi:hypothetical protein
MRVTCVALAHPLGAIFYKQACAGLIRTTYLVSAGLRTLCLAYRDLAKAPADWDVCTRLVKVWNYGIWYRNVGKHSGVLIVIFVDYI